MQPAAREDSAFNDSFIRYCGRQVTQSQVKEISTNIDSNVVKLAAMFCPEGCFGIKKPHHFFFFHLKT